ncbi:DUF7269 family protein [Natrialba swarupiae]|uniref:DUF7269 family protein n=1 Tax=Natrialba swarupiae TaxID=2448032 RepID=UPI00192E5AC3|nr:hypothetical protein [Natrialba swarupiae]
MSRRRREIEDSWWVVLARVVEAESERLAVVVVAAGTVLAVASVVLGGFVPSFGQFLIGSLYLLATLLPVFGVVLALLAFRPVVADGSEDVSPLVDGEPPEEGITRTSARVGRETKWTLDHAANGWYRCQHNESAAEIRNRLAESALRTVRTRRGLTTEAAGDALRTGRWTDDPVAAAFLADDVPQPVGERLRAAVDPGGAYDRRIRRTLEAIEAIERFDTAPSTEDRPSPSEDRRSHEPSDGSPETPPPSAAEVSR